MNVESTCAAPGGENARANVFSAGDVASILLERGWLDAARVPDVQAWLEEAAALLGAKARERAALADLLGLVFAYDARAALAQPEHQAVMSREWARRVLRRLALLVLEGGAVDSDRFKSIIAALKESLTTRGRELFHPVRLALAGRAGEGELDRVILLLDSAAALPFRAAVKGTRARIVEFCAALE
jgi:hypothetical protein